jgi:diaminopimelate decarboxylase
MAVRSFTALAKRFAVPVARRLRPARELAPSTWGLVRRGEDGALALHGQPLSALLRQFGSPLLVFDGATLDRNASAFCESISGLGGLECYFSYKTTPVSGVLDRLHVRGVGAEVISEYELWLARRLGVEGQRIVLNGPGRTPQAMRRAVELGALIHLNHREEIPLLAAIARSVGRRARVGLRIVLDGAWSGQFGEPVSDGPALRCAREAQAHPDLALVALHTHRGAEIERADEARDLVRGVFGFAAQLREVLGVELEIVDFGGSLGCPSSPKIDPRSLLWHPRLGLNFPAPDLDARLGIRAYVREVLQTSADECRRLQMPMPRLFVEPGRALTGNAAMLLCSVTGLKESGSPGLTHAILDAGVNVAEPMRSEFHQIFHVTRPRAEEARYRVVGPICTPMDTLLWSWTSPRLAPGDALAIMDTGAYFIPFATSFSFPQPAIVLVDADGVRAIRAAETFEDMVARDLR